MKVREEKLGNDKVIEVTKPVEQEAKEEKQFQQYVSPTY